MKKKTLAINVKFSLDVPRDLLNSELLPFQSTLYLCMDGGGGDLSAFVSSPWPVSILRVHELDFYGYIYMCVCKLCS